MAIYFVMVYTIYQKSDQLYHRLHKRYTDDVTLRIFVAVVVYIQASWRLETLRMYVLMLSLAVGIYEKYFDHNRITAE